MSDPLKDYVDQLAAEQANSKLQNNTNTILAEKDAEVEVEKAVRSYTRKQAEQIAEEECADLHHAFFLCVKNPPSLAQRFTLCASFKKEYYDCKRNIMKQRGHDM